MPIELVILMLAATLGVALAVMIALTGLARRERRLPVVLGEQTLLGAAIAAVARPRPILLKVRSSRAPPTFPMRQSDRLNSLR